MPDALKLNVDPFDRMLLTADGTVTSLLKACAGEPITARTTRQAGPATLERLLATTGGWSPIVRSCRSPPYEPVRPPSTSAWHRARRWRAARTGSWWAGEAWRR